MKASVVPEISKGITKKEREGQWGLAYVIQTLKEYIKGGEHFEEVEYVHSRDELTAVHNSTGN